MRTYPSTGVLVLVCSGVFVASLDQTVVVTALPEVMVDLGLSITELDSVSWIVSGYLLGFTAAMPLMGRIGDVYGHRLLYQGALVVFAGSSTIVALSHTLEWLVTARVAQAVGGSALFPAALALATNHVPMARRGLILGIVGAAAETGSVLGPLYGGILVDVAGWRWIFWANLPLSGLLMVGLLTVREVPRQRARLDVTGGLLLAVGLALLTVALAQRAMFGIASPLPYSLAACGLTALAILVVVEGHVSQPIISRALFLSRQFVAAFAAQLLVGGALIMALVTIPLMTDTVLGRPPLEGALRLMRFTGAIPFGAVAGGYVSRWLGHRLPTLAGLGLGALSFYWMSGWGLDIGDPALTLHLATGGLGFGLVIAPLLAAAVNAGGEEYRGTAAAFITVARMLGMTLGLATLSAWGMGYFQLLTADLSFPLPTVGETSAAFQARAMAYQQGVTDASLAVFSTFFRVGAGLSVAAAVPALWMYQRRRPGVESEAPPW